MIASKRLLIVPILALSFIQVFSNDVKTLYTNGYYYSQYFLLDENIDADKTLRFSVRAASDAHILLAPSHQADGPVYEIVLGAQDNTINYIRGRCPCQEEPNASIRTVNLLSQKEFRNFWIRIKVDGRRTFVQVGFAGKETPFHEWRDPRPLTLQFLSFRSATAAEWKFGYSDDTYTTGISKDKRNPVVTSSGFGQYVPLSEVVSHSDDAVTLYFTVRSSKEVLILLSPEVNFLGDVYEFGLRDRGCYLRRRHLGALKKAFEEKGSLKERERLRFWIKLTGDGQVMLGRGGSVSPLLKWKDPDPLSPQFISFSLYRSRGDELDVDSFADVQYGLGPDYTLETQDCKPRWKQGTGRLPPAAVRGGRNRNGDLFVCRVDSNGDVIPGSFIPTKGGKGQCQISSGWIVFKKTEFQVLTGCRFSWAQGSLGTVPDGAISGGDTSSNTKLYVSRVPHEGQIIVGTLQPEQRLTFIAYNDHELQYTKYEVLVDLASSRTSSGGQSNNPLPLIG